MCSDSGSLLSNYRGCGQCESNQQRIKQLRVANRAEEEDEDGVEVIRYDHTCTSCQHVVATHVYEFWVEEGRQEYRMGKDLNTAIKY